MIDQTLNDHTLKFKGKGCKCRKTFGWLLFFFCIRWLYQVAVSVAVSIAVSAAVSADVSTPVLRLHFKPMKY